MGVERSIEEALQAARVAMFAALGLDLTDPVLREQALCHPSYAMEQEADPLTANQRLELLGDAVIQLAVSEHLYHHHPEFSEGDLTRVRSFVVRGTVLAAVGRRIGLGSAVRLGHGAEASGGRERTSILACGLEAVIGALYLEHGWDAVRTCLVRLLAPQLEDALASRLRNWKGELQELTQAASAGTPEYWLVDSTGPSHAPRFTVEARLGGELLASGAGRSKKAAEQVAAQAALERLTGAATSALEPSLSEGTSL